MKLYLKVKTIIDALFKIWNLFIISFFEISGITTPDLYNAVEAIQEAAEEMISGFGKK